MSNLQSPRRQVQDKTLHSYFEYLNLYMKTIRRCVLPQSQVTSNSYLCELQGLKMVWNCFSSVCSPTQSRNRTLKPGTIGHSFDRFWVVHVQLKLKFSADVQSGRSHDTARIRMSLVNHCDSKGKWSHAGRAPPCWVGRNCHLSYWSRESFILR